MYIQSMRSHLHEIIDGLPAKPDKVLLTFHGVPNRYIRTGDPYRAQCEQSAYLLANAMNWDDEEWTISFQSRFGPEPWLEPYTDQVLEGLHHQGVERPLVFSPGFLTDCLETLDELGNEGAAQFAEGGGSPDQFCLAPCLNAHPVWIDGMATLVRENAGGWVGDEFDPESREMFEEPVFASV
jgi:ferrochelatase